MPPVTAVSRKGFLALAATAAGAAVAGCGGGDEEERAREARTAADLEIVRYLLRVERVMTAFWEEVEQRDTLRAVAAGQLGAQIAKNERTHVESLLRYERRLSREPSDVPRTDFAAVFAAGPREVLRTGAQMANLAAAAYLGQINRIQDSNILATVLAIHTVEGRQAAAANDAAADANSIFPGGAFAEPMSMAQIRSRLRKVAT